MIAILQKQGYSEPLAPDLQGRYQQKKRFEASPDVYVLASHALKYHNEHWTQSTRIEAQHPSQQVTRTTYTEN